MARKILPNGISTRLRRYNAGRRHRDREMQLLPILSNGHGFLDVGANVGLWSACAARYYDPVIAFEPSEQLADGLRKSLPKHVRVEQCALSDANGEATFYTPLIDGISRDTRASLERDSQLEPVASSEVVKIRTLDDFGFENIDMVKIDVEGHEEAALLGARDTITRELPIMMIEIEERHHPDRSRHIFEYIASLDYSAYYLENKRLKVVAPETAIALQASGPDMPGYINNFIFIPDVRLKKAKNALENAGYSIEGRDSRSNAD